MADGDNVDCRRSWIYEKTGWGLIDYGQRSARSIQKSNVGASNDSENRLISESDINK